MSELFAQAGQSEDRALLRETLLKFAAAVELLLGALGRMPHPDEALSVELERAKLERDELKEEVKKLRDALVRRVTA